MRSLKETQSVPDHLAEDTSNLYPQTKACLFWQFQDINHYSTQNS